MPNQRLSATGNVLCLLKMELSSADVSVSILNFHLIATGISLLLSRLNVAYFPNTHFMSSYINKRFYLFHVKVLKTYITTISYSSVFS